MHPYRGHGRYVGRVGALAVALGIGASIFGHPGTALAGDTDSVGSSSGASADAGSPGSGAADSDTSGAGSATPDVEKPATDNSTPGDADPGDEPAADAPADSESEPDSDAPGDANVPAVDDEPRRGKPSVAKAKAIVTAAAVTAAPVATERTPADEPADMVAGGPEPASSPATVVAGPSRDDDGAQVIDVVKTAVRQQDPQPETVETAVAARALIASDSSSTSTGAPVAPLDGSTFTGLLALISRQLEYIFFNQRPEVGYDSSLNVQSGGHITGDLAGTDADGDILTYTVVNGPKDGVLKVNADGTFTYTPFANLALSGGTDSFLVKVSDYPENPFHIHGLALFFGDVYRSVTVDVTASADTSPLATQDQIDAEKLATEIVNTPIMQFAKFILKMAWRATAEQQFALVGGPDAESLAQLDRAVDEYALQAALELQLLNPNDPHVIQQVMPPHTWFGEQFGGARILYDNPDTIYRMIPVNTSSSYVITGRFTGDEPADTTFSVLTGLTGLTTQVLSGRDLVRNSDGSFTITLDSSPVDGRPNHLQLPAGSTLIAARNTLSDWNTQVPMTLDIERVGGPANNVFSQLGLYAIPGIGPLFSSTPILSTLLSLVPPLDPMPLWLQATETAIVMALGLVMEPQYMAVATTDPDTGELRPPNTLSEPKHNAAFLKSQLQSAGYFQLADDDALVITIDPGSAQYFSVPVTNIWTITDNYWDEQTSLNIAQSERNPDGTYTFVVSATEPCTAAGCMANWVSTGGLNQGTLSIRFQDLGDPETVVTPIVSATVIKLEDLADAVPDDTVYLTPEERRAVLDVRRAGYEKRYAPYPQA